MKALITCFALGTCLLSCSRAPEYFIIDDYLFFAMATSKSRIKNCDSLYKSNKYHQKELLHIYILFSVNYVDKAGKGNNRYYEPGGFGKNGPLDSIREFKVILIDENKKTQNVTPSLYRDTTLNNLYTSGKGLLNYLYDRDCQPIGLPFRSVEEFIHAVNENKSDIHMNNMVYRGLALSLKLENIQAGKYLLKSEMTFKDYDISKEIPIEIF